MKGADFAPRKIVSGASANLLRRLSIVGKHKDLLWQHAAVADEVRHLAGDHGGLAGTRTSEYQRGLLVGCDRRRLFVGWRMRG